MYVQNVKPFGFCKTMHNYKTLMLKELRLVHKNTPFNQNIRFKANVIRISLIYIWVLDSYDTLIVYLSCLMQDCTVITMFDQKGRCMVFTNQESRFFKSFNKIEFYVFRQSTHIVYIFIVYGVYVV